MIKTKFAVMIDAFSISFIISILFLVWINRYIKNAFLSLFCCIIALFCLFIAIYKHFLKKYNLSKLKLKDEKFAQLCFQFLEFCSQKDFESFILKIFNAEKITSNLFENKDTFLYINLKTSLSKQDFFTAHNFYLSINKKKKLTFIYSSLETEFKETLSNSPIKYESYSWLELFELMKEKSCYPINQNTETEKILKLKKLKTSFLNNLSKHKFKEFFFSGLSLIFISLVIPFSFYYLLFGSFFLILSIISLFNKNKIPSSSKQKLSNLIKK